MGRDLLNGVKESYDVVVIGSGLAGLTGANYLAKHGRKVLLLEQHFQLGGLAAWFKRKNGHIFDVSLHGFPVGMIKSCRKYWSKEIADAIVQLKDIRFINPQFSIQTTFDRQDFTRLLEEKFGLTREKIEAFFDHLRGMNFYDNDKRTTGELFEEFFPNRPDIHRLLMEPITYANGSTLSDPAITYGIVFSNFMSQGVYTFKGGTDFFIEQITHELRKNGVDIRKNCSAEKVILDKQGKVPLVKGIVVNGKEIACKSILSNANLRTTVLDFIGENNLPGAYVQKAKDVRINTSSCQVYMGIREGESIPNIGDLIFTSEAASFSSDELLSFETKSRTFSIYYPQTRPQSKSQYAIVSSQNAHYEHWNRLSKEEYAQEKKRLEEETVAALERLIPDIRTKIDWIESATPKTFEHYTKHIHGASFGTKFEGLDVSLALSDHVHGMYHAGSVGIIMSGWLGTINYGVITGNKIDGYLQNS
ncbi:MAG: phytoene dehydrogenase [Verrucomicrobia bacterium GWC2_42_7]|nr:MAG: phytoene dehydrogenase [Verrucomicrobia bacterium GWC2_42_7]